MRIPKKALLLAVQRGLDVVKTFSTTLYTGNGSTQTITNGIDLAGEGGLVWIKARSGVSGINDHQLIDSLRGGFNKLSSNLTSRQTSNGNLISAFNRDGFSLAGGSGVANGDATYASWTFRQAPKFFDIVQYAGDGVAGRQIAHDLGVAPGMMIVKSTNGTTGWFVYHQNASASGRFARNAYGVLNNTAAFANDTNAWQDTDPTSTDFTVGLNSNQSGLTYIAYLFAHDPSDSGIIQCGSFVNMSPGQTVNLGWQPQYIMVKRTDGADNWVVIDTARGFSENDDRYLFPNSSQGESGGVGASSLTPTATGFKFDTTYSGIYIYMAIKAPE